MWNDYNSKDDRQKEYKKRGSCLHVIVYGKRCGYERFFSFTVFFFVFFLDDGQGRIARFV